jgi:hypothetical protein
MRVVDRDDHIGPRLGEQQQPRHRLRRHFAASRDLDGGANHVLKFGRFGQGRSNVQRASGVAGARGQRRVGHLR